MSLQRVVPVPRKKLSQMADEWDQVASQYVDIFLPRFQPIYDYVAQTCQKHGSRSVLDYACGPGEPGTTIFKLGIPVTCADFALHMLQQIKAPVPKIHIEHQSLQEMGSFDTIINSLGLMYMDKSWIDQAYESLPKGGLLITTHWPHASLVPTLRILKQANGLKRNETLSMNYLEHQDATFSMWNPESTRPLFKKFKILEYTDIDVPMHFENAAQLVAFSGYQGEELDLVAQHCKNLVQQHLGSYQEPFVLENKCTIVVCQK
jgi:SAM-dependent methyltransferase